MSKTDITATFEFELSFEVTGTCSPATPDKGPSYSHGGIPGDPAEADIDKVRIGIPYRYDEPVSPNFPNGPRKRGWRTRWIELTPQQQKQITEIVACDPELSDKATEALWEKYDSSQPDYGEDYDPHEED